MLHLTQLKKPISYSCERFTITDNYNDNTLYTIDTLIVIIISIN